MFTNNLQYQRQVVADRQEQLRRYAGATRTRRDARRRARGQPRP